jgi:glycosyltransferase involved in cell wall biosynthesis
MPAYLPVSVVIISLNEERRIGDCLASVRGLTDDIIVVDAQSTDRTAELATAAGARVVSRKWSGYSDQKNCGNALARHDWILSLDADERVTSTLAASIREEFARGLDCAAYDVGFENYFGESRVRFGAWNPESHVRLFDRRKFEWSCDEVHEGLRGLEPLPIGNLTGCIRHYTVDSHAQLAAKTQRYSVLFAEKLRRQRRRPTWLKVWLNPAFRFTRDYVFRGGMLDGRAGLVIAWESARYTHLKYRLALSPTASGEFDWRWLGLAATISVALPILAVIFFAPDRPVTEASPRVLTMPTHSTASYANDGFDNSPISAPNHPVDEDVLI